MNLKTKDKMPCSSLKKFAGLKTRVFFLLLFLFSLPLLSPAQELERVFLPDSILDGNSVTILGKTKTRLVLTREVENFQKQIFSIDPDQLGTAHPERAPLALKTTQYILSFVLNDNHLFVVTQDGSGILPELWKIDPATGDQEKIFQYEDHFGFYTGMIFKNEKLFFPAQTASSGDELWVSDGTVAGTHQLADLIPGPDSGTPRNFMPFGDQVLFQAINDQGAGELWISDGTTAGTHLVKEINPFGAPLSGQSGITIPGSGNYLFAADDSLHGFELWQTDGTDAGTFMIKDLNPGPDDSSPYNFVEHEGAIYFFAGDTSIITYSPSGSYPVPNSELFRTDGTSNGTWMVKDLNGTKQKTSSPRELCSLKGKLYFAASADSGSTHSMLWESDGTNAGTQVIRDFCQELFCYPPQGFIVDTVQQDLYFFPSENQSENPVWKIDGESGNLEFISTIESIEGKGRISSGPVILNEHLFFSSYFSLFTLYLGNPSEPVELDDLDLKIFPVPFEDEINISGFRYSEVPVSLVLFDELGRKVYADEIISSELVTLRGLEKLPPGIWFLRISNEQGSITRKLLKTHR